MGFFNFNNLADNNLQCIPFYSGENGDIFDSCLHKDKVAFLNGEAAIYFWDKDLVALRQPTSAPVPGALSIIGSNQSRIFLANSTLNVYYSDDDGVTWSSSSAVGGATIKQFLVNQNTVLGVQNSGTGNMKVSTDGGVNWVNTVGLTNFTTVVAGVKQSAKFIPQLNLYVMVGIFTGNGAAIAYSNDCVNWTQVTFNGIEVGAGFGFSAVDYFAGEFYLGCANNGRIYKCDSTFSISSLQRLTSASDSPTNATGNAIARFLVYNGALYAFKGTSDFSAYKLVDNKFKILSCNYAASSQANRMCLEFNGQMFVAGGQYIFTNMNNFVF